MLIVVEGCAMAPPLFASGWKRLAHLALRVDLWPWWPINTFSDLDK